MAKRYSGSLVIDCTWQDQLDTYKCTISRAGKHLSTQYVGRISRGWGSVGRGVDHPDAYDQTAHAALSFADHEGAEIGSYAHHTGSGWSISRRAPARHTASAHTAPRPSRAAPQRPAGHRPRCPCVVCARR